LAKEKHVRTVCSEEADGSKFWTYADNPFIYHREDGPACEWSDGSKSWWLHGRRHREDGPAIERGPSGNYTCTWIWHDQVVPVKTQREFEAWKKMKAFW
jgi:hypothetical protein